MLNLTSSAVLLYPTDTIYGLGGLITPEVVDKINRIKQRPAEKAYSIIAPSLEWIPRYFAVPNAFTPERTKRMRQFPGRGLTLILPLRDDRPRDIDFSLITNNATVGVRLLHHPFQEEVYKLGKPLITTSANLSGQPNITQTSQITDKQRVLIDQIIDEGIVAELPSVIVNWQTGEIIRR